MSIFLAVMTAITLIITVIVFWKSYRLKAIFHPGVYFCLLWIISVISYLLINTFDNKYNTVIPEFVDELNGYVLFTALAFIFFIPKGKLFILKNNSIWEIKNFEIQYRIMSMLAFVSAIILFISRGASFNFSLNRNQAVDYDTMLFIGSSSQSFLNTLFGAFTAINLLLGIFAGNKIAEKLRGNKQIIGNFFLFLPLITQIIMMIMVGGRNDFIWILRCYVFGFSICISNGISLVKIKKIILSSLAIFILFLTYSQFNIEQRKNDIHEAVAWDNSSVILSPFSSVLEYFSEVYIGYQFKRNDYVTPDIEWGEKTFSGVLFLEVPFANTIGLSNSSIGELLGLEQYSMKKMFLELQEQNSVWFSSVASIYLIIYDDFGYWGAYGVIFILVWLTQVVFIRWFKQTNRAFLSLYFPFLFFILWSNSIFDPVFATGNVKTILYSIFCLDLFKKFTN